MANYDSLFRTSYFKVTDPEAFQKQMEALGLTIITQKDEDGSTLYGVYGDGEPDYNYETDENFDFSNLLAPHLAKGWVAIGMTIGNENMRYLVGYAWAVNWKSEQKWISIENIYKLAGQMGTYTEATY